MKVYVVRANNCAEYAEDFNHWVEGIFSSRELAEKYIVNEEERYDRDEKRINELGELVNERYKNGTYDSFEKYGWTAEEDEEYQKIQDYWRKAWRCCPYYFIDEMEIDELVV